MRRSAPFVLEAVDRHRRAVGQLLAEQPEELLAQQLGGEEALVAVGELVLRIQRRPLAAGRAAISPQQLVELRPASARSPARSRRRRASARRCASNGSSGALSPTMSILLIARSTTCPASGSSASTARSAAVEAQRLDHEEDHVDVREPPRAPPVQPVVERARDGASEARRVDEDELRALGVSGCRGCGGAWSAACATDADASARPARSAASTCRRSAGRRGRRGRSGCSARQGQLIRLLRFAQRRRGGGLLGARRLAPRPGRDDLERGDAHSTSNDCACASPCAATTAYSGSASCGACRHSCRRVLASLPGRRVGAREPSPIAAAR